MKADARKRRIFDDAVDLLCGAEDMAVPGSGIQMLPIDSISPFRNHPFRLYEGERLEDMVESIREHGILNPVIVWKNAEGYEMLAGHNRQNAGRLVGLTEVPAIVKYDLTEKEAYVYVIETNVMQRGFAELLPSEKAAVLAERYEKVSNQGRRNDILQEIAKLNGADTETCGHDVHRNIARYIRVNQLEQPLKELLDEGGISLVSAVELSYLSPQEQRIVSDLAGKEKIKLNDNTVKRIKAMAGDVTREHILENMGNKKSDIKKTIKLSLDVYEKYFKDIKAKDVAGIVENALAVWFSEERDNV